MIATYYRELLNNGHFGTTNIVRYTEAKKVTCIFNELARHVTYFFVSDAVVASVCHKNASISFKNVV